MPHLTTASQSPKKPKILVVDDFETVRILFEKYLKELNIIDITQAENGQEALALLKAAQAEETPFDLIFADWNMPTMNGLELLVAVRRSKDLNSTPFVMVTSNSDDTAVVDAMRAGVSDYLVKPFDPSSLAETIDRVLTKLGTAAA